MIPDIKKILYVTDLSQNASYAFRYAVKSMQSYDVFSYSFLGSVTKRVLRRIRKPVLIVPPPKEAVTGL